MTDFPNHRKVVAACPCAGGEAIFCDDGATFFSFPDSINPRVLVEGTPVPGTQRADELKGEVMHNRASEWEMVARNLAQILTNTAAWVDDASERFDVGTFTGLNAESLRSAFKDQCEAHGVTP